MGEGRFKTSLGEKDLFAQQQITHPLPDKTIIKTQENEQHKIDNYMQCENLIKELNQHGG